MFVVIFGRPACPFCVRAKEHAETLKAKRDDFNYRYVDIHAEGISKADLEKTVGKPVDTVPQIFIDQDHNVDIHSGRSIIGVKHRVSLRGELYLNINKI